jgi:hypothetical protein
MDPTWTDGVSIALPTDDPVKTGATNEVTGALALPWDGDTWRGGGGISVNCGLIQWAVDEITTGRIVTHVSSRDQTGALVCLCEGALTDL